LSFNTAEFWKMPETETISKGFQMHRSVEFSFLERKWNISLWPQQHGLAKQHDAASHHAVHHQQQANISWIDINVNRRKSMNHWRQETAAKFVVHCAETRRGSCAGSVEFLCTLSNLLPKLTAESKALHALSFLLYSTLQRCYCVKDVCLQGLWLCEQVLSQLRLWENSIAH